MATTRPNPWTDADVERHWDAVADIYVEENDNVKEAHDQRFAVSMQWLDVETGQRVLNITSRDCEAADYIGRQCPDVRVTNAEISRGLMEAARAIRPHVEQVKLSDYSRLPFQDAEFDRVLSLETLEHVAEPIAFLRELHRVSRDDARLVLSCPPATSEPAYRVYTALSGGHGEGPHRFLRSKVVKALLAETDWNLLHHEGTLLFPVGPACLRRWGERLISRSQGTFVAEMGIRQFYVCDKSG